MFHKMKNNNKLVAPFLKWVGGKRQIISAIFKHMPVDMEAHNYVEPFIGGGAVLFNLQPKNALINDFNPELINVYQVIKDKPDELIKDLKGHKNSADYFYKLRGIDRTVNFQKLTPVQKASRVIYLNKTCFNGLYRVNSAGEFNVPFGRYKNPNIVNEQTIRAVHSYLNSGNIQIKNDDYEDILSELKSDSFVYLDPPYHPISQSSSFTGYIQGGWNEKDQIRLRKACDDLNRRGVKFLQSNSSSDFIKDQYKSYNITTVKATRAINSNGSGRGEIDEVLIQNYE